MKEGAQVSTPIYGPFESYNAACEYLVRERERLSPEVFIYKLCEPEQQRRRGAGAEFNERSRIG